MGSRAGNAGFSLLKLMAVVTIMGVVATLAVPTLLQPKKGAAEAAAITYMRSWSSAQELYCLKYGVYADADNQLFNEGLISGHAPADAHGYKFSLDNPSNSKYTWWGEGWPERPGETGDRFFFIDQSGVIRWSTTGQADSNSTPL